MSMLVDLFRERLISMPVAHVWRGYGSALFLEFGLLTPTTLTDGRPGRGQGEITLMIQWSWRIEAGPSIICGSWSDEALWLPTFERLVGREVVDLSTFGRLPEIFVSLSDGYFVASFMTDNGDPDWALIDRTGGEIFTIRVRNGKVVKEAPR